jgi:LPXTG-motif cell wall-anchored protein
MNRKTWSGLLGIIVGGGWLLYNLQYVKTQGFVAIGMPLLILGLGIVYFIKGRKDQQ